MTACRGVCMSYYMCYNTHLTAPGCHVFQAVDPRRSCPLTPSKHSRIRGEDRFSQVLAPWRCADRFALPEQGLACGAPALGWLCPYMCRQQLRRGCPGTGGSRTWLGTPRPSPLPCALSAHRGVCFDLIFSRTLRRLRLKVFK